MPQFDVPSKTLITSKSNVVDYPNVKSAQRTGYSKTFFASSKKKWKPKEYNPTSREMLYSEKLFGRNLSSNKTETNKTSSKFYPSDGFKHKKIRFNSIKLPSLCSKIIFQKGATDKLLDFEFYNTSYKACCEISKATDQPNSSIKKNFKNNWKVVQKFADDQK